MVSNISINDEKIINLQYGNSSQIYMVTPWQGIYLWANLVSDRHLPYEKIEGTRSLTINYCISGRCEVSLPNDSYIYMKPEMLCIDSHEPKDGFNYPTGEYTGLEMAIDLDSFIKDPPAALVEYGDFAAWFEEILKDRDGTHIGSISPSYHDLIVETFQSLVNGKGQIKDYKLYTLMLLIELMGDGMGQAHIASYVTKGQRLIIAEVEHKITEDLSKRYTVSELAKGSGISPSSLKVYFEKVYGEPISKYIKRLRIERAKELLSGTEMRVADISEECGYAHQGKFGEVFKNETGISPLEYRRRFYKREEHRNDEIE